MRALRCVRKLYVLIGVLSLAACSNGRGSLDGPEASQAQAGFTIGVSVSGLVGSGLVLQNNGSNDLAIASNGTSTFSRALSDGTDYSVTVLTQPTSPAQACTVSSGTGRVATANVSNVTVSCVTTGPSESFAVGGTVTGLAGGEFVLRNNGGDDLPIAIDGPFSFSTPIATGAAYQVTVATQPPGQTCTVVNGSGTMGGAEVTNVTVTCATSAFSIGGSVSGLAGNAQVVLQNNGGNDLTVANGSFAFPVRLANGSPYSVTVKTNPSGQNCSVQNPSGVVAGANVVNVAVNCSALLTVGGRLSGLASRSTVRLRNNGGDEIELRANGSFTFPTHLARGTAYFVNVSQDPLSPVAQQCSIANSSGTVLDANIDNVLVTCVTRSFAIGGSVQSLAGSGLVLQLNNGEQLSIASNGNFTFSTAVASGAEYRVQVSTPPTNPSQNCTVMPERGTVGSGDVRNIQVTCATSTFTVGGSASGVIGNGLVLQNNGGDNIEIESNGRFDFPSPIASGGTYNVTVAANPSNPTQACSVAQGAGSVTTANITTVAVSCTTSSFRVGGTISGLTGTGLVLRNNGGDDLQLNADGNFSFATAVPSGATYSAAVVSQPTNPTQSCTIANAAGTVGGGDVTNLQVSCVTVGFSVGGSVSGLAGSGLRLQNNGGEEIAIAANGSFAFPTSLLSGSSYNVTITQQPANPTQTCSVFNGSGSVSSGDVTSVTVSCVTNTYTIGGTVSGLGGGSMILRNNGGETLTVSSNGTFTFPTPVPSGSPYSVTVVLPPLFPPQSCSVSGGAGTVGAANVTDVTVSCL